MAAWLGYTDALVGELLAAPERTQRRRRGTNFYLAVALLYARACEEQPRKPYSLVMKWLQEHGDPLSRSTAANAVLEARRRGYLSHGKAGVPCGKLMPPAIEALQRLGRSIPNAGTK